MSEVVEVDLERRLREAALAGTVVDLRSRDPRQDDPIRGAEWGEQRTISAELLGTLARTADVDGRPLRKIWLRGARVEGALDLEGARISCPIILQSCHFAAPLMLDAAEIVSLDLAGSRIESGFFGRGLRCRGDIVCGRGLHSLNSFEIMGARIGGDFDAADGIFENAGDAALAADRIVVEGGVFLGVGFSALGEVRFLGAAIGGQLSVDESRMERTSGPAFSGDGMSVKGGIFFVGRFLIIGETRLLGARVHGQLTLADGTMRNEDEQAFNGDGMHVDGAFLCRGLSVEGGIRVTNSAVTGPLRVSHSTVANRGGVAFDGGNAQFNGGVSCTESTFAGTISFAGCDVRGDAHFRTVKWGSADGIALDFQSLSVSRGLYLQPREAGDGWINLDNVAAGHLSSSSETWSRGYELGGMTYGQLWEAVPWPDGRTRWRPRSSVDANLEWIAGNRNGYLPQLYEQLAEYYRATGHEQRQRAVLVAKQRHRRRHLSPAARAWNVVEDLLVGYGYRTWQALIPFVLLLAGGWWYFGHEAEIVQRNPRLNAPDFNALTFTLDQLLPVINLGQRDYWVASGDAQTVATVLVLAGWVLTTAIIAALTGLVRRTS
ncbi:hypothetical protein VSS74_23545 [Conexibacter stalactiti]|uniref:Oxidoreductase n=1 Tax=Conexibacter stalactiti TaxID=1940611 RepID=A0ABU4HVI7_9ACTN|nr:hypothetical protein [Conexibacter stalactiti]MDW5597342.1 hypothetical protein [Conexibacter stalactiti]MEC5037984.1 hypothetical protein [Conexibacter stalactiti]